MNTFTKAFVFLIALVVALTTLAPWAVMLWARLAAEVSEPILAEAACCGSLTAQRATSAIPATALACVLAAVAVVIWRRRTADGSFGRVRRFRTRVAVGAAIAAATVVGYGVLSPLVAGPRWLEDAGATIVLVFTWVVVPLLLIALVVLIALGVWALGTSTRAGAFRAAAVLVLAGAGGQAAMWNGPALEFVEATHETVGDELEVIAGRPVELPDYGWLAPRGDYEQLVPEARSARSTAPPIRVFAWNVNSGIHRGANAQQLPFILQSVSGLEHEIIALSEVESTWAEQIENARRDSGRQVGSVVGTTGNNQRLQVLFDTARFQYLRHAEMTGVVEPPNEYRRSPLSVVLRDLHTNREIEIVAIHLTLGRRETGDAERAAEAARLRDLLATRGAARNLVVIGDANVQCSIDEGPMDCAPAMHELTLNDVLTWVAPQPVHPTFCSDSPSEQSILDIALIGSSSSFSSARSRVHDDEGWCTNMAPRGHYPIELTLEW